MIKLSRTRGLVTVGATVLLTLLALGGAASASVGGASGAIKRGGNLTITIDVASAANWASWDPANTNSYLDGKNMVYDELFAQGQDHAVRGSLATGYSITDHNLLIKVFLRHGVKFSDGTPFNSAAVIYNWQRDLNTATGCTCKTNFLSVQSVYPVGQYQADMVLSYSFAPVIDAMIGSALDYIVSPTAFAAEGATNFGQAPVGAGPYLVSTTIPLNKVILTRNPHYWDAPRPYLNSITVITVGTDNSNLASLQAGQSQVGEAITTPSVLSTVKSDGLKLLPQPATGVWFMNFDTYAPPMNNLIAREAVEYAIDVPPVNQAINLGEMKPIQSPATSGDLFYTPKVPGYRTYNPKKAQALVQQLGGSLNLNVLSAAQTTGEEVIEAFMQYWKAVGITSTLEIATGLANYIQIVSSHNFSVVIAYPVGGYDDSLSLTGWLTCTGSTSIVCDPKLQTYFRDAQGDTNPATRASVMKKLFTYVNQQAYMYTLYTAQTYIVTTKAVQNIDQGTTTIWWPYVWMK